MRDIFKVPLVTSLIGGTIYLTSIISEPKVETNTMSVVVKEVYDGDTFYIDIDNVPPVFGKRIPVRVNGIDSPELRTSNKEEKAKGYEAKKFAEELLLNKRVTLENMQRDKYFRILADVKLGNGDDYGRRILYRELARTYDGGYKEGWNKD